MKIAFVLTGGLHPSGREQIIPAVVALIEWLAREHEVHAFALRHLPQPQQYSFLGATVHDLGRPKGLRRQWRALMQCLVDFGPFDVIHGYWALPAGVLAARAGRRLRTPSIVSCDSGEFTSLDAIGYGLQRTLRGRIAVRLACRWASAVHVTSKYMQALASDWGVEATLIPLGIELDRFASNHAPAHSPPWQLLQVASLNPVKDQSTLLRAVALARRTMDVRLTLAGEDTMNGRLQAEAASLGLSSAVQFLGFVPQDALVALLQKSHLYVQSSRHEAAGLAVVEAAAAGLPVVGTNVGYVSDWNDDATFAVEPGNAGALADAIVRLLNDPAHRRALQVAARRRVQEHHVDRTTRAMTAFYDSVRATQSARAPH